MVQRHSEDTQTLASELLALLLAAEGEREWSHLAGTFTTKTIADRDYVYFQYSDPGGRKRQFAVGPSSAAIDRIVERYNHDRTTRAPEEQHVLRLAGLLRAAGLPWLPHPVGRVLGALADAGVFRFGGVLVGTYAFTLLGNLLGVVWPEGALRTKDVDVAAHVEIAAPAIDADVPRALDALQMGFVPVPQLDPRHASTSFKVRGQDLRVDLITPGRSGQEKPVLIRRFHAAAAPIRHLSLLIDEAQPAPAVHRGATLVVVPTPARFALHKLLVSQNRPLSQQTKSVKDLHQAALLLEVLAEDRPEDLDPAAHAFVAAGPSVAVKVQRGLVAVGKRFPDAAAGVAAAQRLLGR